MNRMVPILAALDFAVERGDYSRLSLARDHVLDVVEMLRPPAPVQHVDVNEIALQAASRARVGIQVTVKLDPARPSVLMERMQLARALFNLIDNAAAALAETSPAQIEV